MRIFIIRRDKDVAVSTQEEAAAIWRADRKVYIDRAEHNLKYVDIRPTDVVGIYRLDMLAAQGKKASKRARQSLLEYMTTVFRNEGTIEEYISGRSCDDKATLLEMYQEACDRFLAGYKSNRPSGRPKKRIYTDEQAEFISLTWKRKDLANAEARIAAIQSHPKMGLENFNKAAWYDPNLQNQIAKLKEQSK